MATFTQPLIDQLIGRLHARPPDDQEAYNFILREMRRYNGASIVEAALRILWTKYATKVDELQMAPWHILLLVKWALKDPHISLRTGPQISAEAFDNIRQRVLDLVGLEHRRHRPEKAMPPGSPHCGRRALSSQVC